MAKKSARQGIAKAGSSQSSAALRRKVFAERYLVNGNNASEAAEFAGLSPKTAYSAGHRMLDHPEVKALLATRIEKVLIDAELTTERWAKEMACIGHFDMGDLYDEAGNLIPIKHLPEHVRRAIASVKPNDDGTFEVKPWDKNAALANIGKHLGMFERDNMQKAEPVHVTITLVGRNNGAERRSGIAGETRVLNGSSSIQDSLRR